MTAHPTAPRTTPTLHRLAAGLALACACALAPGLAPAATPAPAAKPAAKPSAKAAPKPAPRPPAATPLPAATGEQMEAAAMVLYGRYDCDFGQTVEVFTDPQHAGYVGVRLAKQSWVMKPVLSSTGALRIEDVKARMLLLQIANKSMLMDVVAGRRLVDECVHETQRQAMAARAAAEAAAASAAAPAAATGATTPGGPGPERVASPMPQTPAPAVSAPR